MTVAGGTPTLTLNDGGTATYTGGSGTNALTFSYTVAPARTPPTWRRRRSISTARPSRMAPAMPPTLSRAVTNPTGTCRSTPRRRRWHRWWRLARGHGSGMGSQCRQVVTLTLNLSEAVTVAGGTPTLTLNDGGTATYTGGSGSNALTFSYTVAPGRTPPTWR